MLKLKKAATAKSSKTKLSKTKPAPKAKKPSALSERINALESSFLAKSNRERWMILGVVWILVGYGGMLVYESTLQAAVLNLEQKKAGIMSQLSAQAQENAELNNGIALLARQEREHNEQLEQLNARLAVLNVQVDERMRTLVTPDQMSELLLSMLEQSKGLELLDLSNQAPLLMTLPEDTEPLYRHGLSVSLSGSYMSLLSYVDLLEQLSGQIFWRGLELEIEEHPTAIIRLDFFTISQEKELLRG